ncbi:heterokaryon incompatibility protein-domain-containing protein, partial [Phaeosphaeriaceae sp. PMI808]
MWLINTSTLQLEWYTSIESTPPYAILSHTWGKEKYEVSFNDMKTGIRLPEIETRYGFEKIKMTCQLAREVHNLTHAWVDTCCIDKSSSAELSEAINSMFKWYHCSTVCLAFLVDWGPDDETFGHCKWFTRGWTLQELIAPKKLIFYDKTWQARGDKITLCSKTSQITGIIEKDLTGQRPLSEIPVAVRMSWASSRITTREEDMAYCLLGIFDINMPMLYGEGQKAFQRLQEEIIKEYADMTIFAWR